MSQKYYFVSMVRQGPNTNGHEHGNFVLDVHPADYVKYSRKHLDPVGAIDHINFYAEIEEREFDLLKDTMYMGVPGSDDNQHETNE